MFFQDLLLIITLRIFRTFGFFSFFQGVIIFHDAFDDDHEGGGAQIRVEGVYIWPFRQLRMVANR